MSRTECLSLCYSFLVSDFSLNKTHSLERQLLFHDAVTIDEKNNISLNAELKDFWTHVTSARIRQLSF